MMNGYYAGYHDAPGEGQRFVVFRIERGWFWMNLVVHQQMGPYPDSETAYRAALEAAGSEAS